MVCNSLLRGVVFATLLCFGLTAATTAQTTETVAFWEFNGVDFLADSSGNGHTLVDGGGYGVTQLSDTASFYGGWLNASSIDLTPYEQVTISWDMNYTAGTILFEQTENFNYNEGAFVGLADSAGIKCPNGLYNMDSYTPSVGWHSYKVVYSVVTEDVAEVVKIFEDNIEVGTAAISGTTGLPIQNSPPTTFLNTALNIGARDGGISPFEGQIDNFMITGQLPRQVPEPTPGLVAHYQFDGNLNNSVDDIAAATVGTTPEVMFVDGPEGIAGQAVDLSGSDWYINCGDEITTSSETLTVTAWIYDNFEIPATDHNYCAGIVTKDGFRDGDWALRRYSFIGAGYTLSGRAQMLIGGENDAYALTDEGTVASGQWVHLAATYETTENGSEIKLYIDGVLSTTTTLDEPVGSSTFSDILIGYDAANQTHFDGLIADVRVYNDLLDVDDILAIMTPDEKVAGDANGDGKVDGSDVTILANNWQAGVPNGDPENVTGAMGDFNGDGKVDGSDVTILANNWQYGVTTAASSVPEPSTIILILSSLFAIGMWRCRR